MGILIAIVVTTSGLTMEAPIPETSAKNAGCTIPFEASPDELNPDELDLDEQFISEAAGSVLDFCDDAELSAVDRITVANCLLRDTIEEFEQDLLAYVSNEDTEEDEEPAELDPFAIASTAQAIERLKIAAEALYGLSLEYEEEGDEDGESEEELISE